MRIGVPASSANCLDGARFLVLAREAGLMRVPRPAAGIITTTFMAGCQYTSRDAASSNPRAVLGAGRRDARRAVSLPYSAGGSVRKGCGFLGSTLAAPATAATGGRGSGREAARSSHLPKIIFPAVVCSTLVTEMS